MKKKILRMPDVQARTGLSHSAIYQYMAEGTFPKPIKINKHANGWLEHEIDKWIIDGRIKPSRQIAARVRLWLSVIWHLLLYL